MNHADHVRLIQKGIEQKNQIWADFGSGDGAFTLALADLLDPKSTIYSVDQDEDRLQNQKSNFSKQFPLFHIEYLHDDFTNPLVLPKLDGIIMANSLHYIRHKGLFLKGLKKYLKDDGRLIIIEYNVDQGNTWVPYPISFSSLRELSKRINFSQPELLATTPSMFLEEIYSVLVMYEM